MSITTLIDQKLANLPEAAKREFLGYLDYLEYKYSHTEGAVTDKKQEQQWQLWFDNLSNFSNDFMTNREQPPLT